LHTFENDHKYLSIYKSSNKQHIAETVKPDTLTVVHSFDKGILPNYCDLVFRKRRGLYHTFCYPRNLYPKSANTSNLVHTDVMEIPSKFPEKEYDVVTLSSLFNLPTFANTKLPEL